MSRRGYSRRGISIPSKYILLALSVLCVFLMLISFSMDFASGPLEGVAGVFLVPFQKGIATAGSWMSDKKDNFNDIEELQNENEKLKEQVDELIIKVNDLQRDKYELAELRTLFKLDEQYSDFEKIGARVIGKDTGNWFSSFIIDKGSRDGILVDMNVMSGSGLVGIITEVGPNWSTVKSIIDDSSNLSGMVMSTSDTLIVTGDLEAMEEGNITFSQLLEQDEAVVEGDQVVTSAISDKYLPGISIGYVKDIHMDSNNITKSGYITPVVDFKHLSTVLVITELKEQRKELVEEEK